MEPMHTQREVPALALHDFFRLIGTYWRGIALIALLCPLLALGWTLLQPKIYSATATGVIVATGAQDYSQAVAGENLAQTKAISYESISSARPVAERVIQEIGLNETPESLASKVATEVPMETSQIRVTAEASSPQEAAEIANVWLNTLSEEARQIEGPRTETGTALNALNFETVSQATAPLSPSSPNLVQNMAVGFLAALLFALLYIFVRSGTDRSIRSAADIRASFDVPVLGTIPTNESLDKVPAGQAFPVNASDVDRPYTEAVRKLRTNLSFISVDNPPKIIVVTSALPGEGKSSITANLAVAIASTGRNVVVVDGDLRRPMLTKLFELPEGIGITNVLTGRIRVEEVTQTYDKFPNLQVLGAGRTAPNPTELLSSKAMHHMLETLSEDALVLVDAPPLLPVTDAALLTASADGAIIVATAQKTTTDELSKALENLHQVHGHVLGVVLNRVPASPEKSYGRSKNYARHETRNISAIETKESITTKADR